MSMPAALTDGLKLLGALLGDESLALDEAGMCSLSHQDGLVTMLIADPTSDMLLLSAQLFELPSENREALLSGLLRLNFLGMDTGGAALAIDEEERHVYLCHNVPLQRVDDKALVAIIGNFIDTAANLRKRLLAQGITQDADATGHSGSATSFGRPNGWIAG